MLKAVFILIALPLLSVVCNGALGQAMASASVSATIVAAPSFIKNTDMHSGGISLNMPARSAVSRRASKSAAHPAGQGPYACRQRKVAASFTLSGERGFLFAVTMPAFPVKMLHRGYNICISGFTSSVGRSRAIRTGDQSIRIGAVLEVAGKEKQETDNMVASNVEVVIHYY
jgi:hypothetical protein